VTAQGLTYLDCPVSGTSDMIARGEGIIICGGDPAVFERERSVLEAMLPEVVHVGAAGQATLLALVAETLAAVHTAAAAEALNLARRAGFDPDLLLAVLGASAGASRMLEVRGPMMARDEFPARASLALLVKAVDLLRDEARALGSPLRLADVAQSLFTTARDAGHGDADPAVVIKSLEP
jgi:3-hydroxyisobutyrate dehydrogenase-like beta-hydroxyacid dehydrogenase